MKHYEFCEQLHYLYVDMDPPDLFREKLSYRCNSTLTNLIFILYINEDESSTKY